MSQGERDDRRWLCQSGQPEAIKLRPCLLTGITNLKRKSQRYVNLRYAGLVPSCSSVVQQQTLESSSGHRESKDRVPQ
jgi:hypothetical protein